MKTYSSECRSSPASKVKDARGKKNTADPLLETHVCSMILYFFHRPETYDSIVVCDIHAGSTKTVVIRKFDAVGLWFGARRGGCCCQYFPSLGPRRWAGEKCTL